VAALDRALFPVAERYHYLNHAGMAAPPRPVTDAMARAAEITMAAGTAADPSLWGRAEEVRATAGRLLGVPSADVALIKNTTEGLGFVAHGIRWAEGDRVIVPSHEYPANLLPWLALRDWGVDVHLIEPIGPSGEVPLEVISAALDAAPTRVVAISWVQFARGWRTDLAVLADLVHAHGALLLVDAVQGVGAIPAAFEAWGVDVAIAGSHKWQLGPEGTGLLYATPAAREQLAVLQLGSHSVDAEGTLLAGAARFEGGTRNTVGQHGQGAALDLLLDARIDAIWRHVDALVARAAAGLAEAGAEVLTDRTRGGSSGIVAIRVDRVEPDELCSALLADGIVVAPRGGSVRISPHGWNDDTDIDALIESVTRLIAKAGRMK
jgi:selenocysteine lyase/cysteine desulfurase